MLFYIGTKERSTLGKMKLKNSRYCFNIRPFLFVFVRPKRIFVVYMPQFNDLILCFMIFYLLLTKIEWTSKKYSTNGLKMVIVTLIFNITYQYHPKTKINDISFICIFIVLKLLIIVYHKLLSDCNWSKNDYNWACFANMTNYFLFYVIITIWEWIVQYQLFTW